MVWELVPIMTSCSPTILPMRMAWMPISLGVRLPCPLRPVLTVASGRTSRMAPAMASAVPLGASTLRSWCFSMISISASGIAAAVFFASSMSSATPREQLAEKNSGTSVAAARMAAFSTSVWPVVARTRGS